MVARKTSAGRAVEADTAGWRTVGSFGWSREDGYRSRGGEEEGKEGREMHAGSYWVWLGWCGVGLV